MDGSRPDPERIGSVAELARELSTARERAGLTVRQVQKQTDIAASTLGGYFSGRHRPPLAGLEKVLAACGIDDPATVEAWRAALVRVRRIPKRAVDGVPYRGLEAFRAGDAAWFFGRSRLTAAVLGRIEETTGPLVVVGPSGAGKSSLLRAGVVPALAPTPVVVCTPGPGVPDVEPGGVLICDQFEEIFAPGVTEVDRTAFVDALLASPARVVIGLRADFYAPALRHPGLAAALQDNQVIVEAMRIEELREIIVEPAARAGVEIEAGLVELLLRDADLRGAGALPLLSHALLTTWQQGAGRMTVADYRATGGVAGAVARTAEDAVTALGPEQLDAVRRLFLRLVHVVPDAPDTRRRVARTDVGDAELLDEFVARRLLVVDLDTVEIAHEALLVAWPRLREWIDADRLGIIADRRLAENARAWQDAGEDPDVLPRGAQLAAATERASADLTAVEQRFLDAAQEQERRRVTARRRQTRRLRRLVAALAVLLLIAVGLGAYSVRQGVVVAGERDVAVSRQVAVRSDALRAEDPALAAQLAVAAYRIAPTSEARSSLLNATAAPVPTRLIGPAAVTQAIAVDRARRVLVSASGSGETLQVWTLDGAAARVADTAPAGGPLQAVALSPDGRTLAAGGAEGDVVLVDMAVPDRPGTPLPLTRAARWWRSRSPPTAPHSTPPPPTPGSVAGRSRRSPSSCR